MRRQVTFERLEVGDDLPRVVAEDRAAGGPEQDAEEEPARIAAEGALPHHLDPAAALRWRRGELPAAAGVGVDVGAGHRRSESPRVLWRLPIHGRVGRWEQHGSIRTSCVTGRSGWCWTWSRTRTPA